MNISVCPDVVSLRGVANNGKLGQYLFYHEAFVHDKQVFVDIRDKSVITRGLIPFLSSSHSARRKFLRLALSRKELRIGASSFFRQGLNSLLMCHYCSMNADGLKDQNCCALDLILSVIHQG